MGSGAAPQARGPSSACRGPVAAVSTSDTALEVGREEGGREEGGREEGGREGGAREEAAKDTQSPARPQPAPAVDAAAAARRCALRGKGSAARTGDSVINSKRV